VVDWLGAVAYSGPGDCRCRLPAVTAFLRRAPCRFFAPAYYLDDRPCCWKSCDAAVVVVAVLAAADGSGAAVGHYDGGEEQQRGPGWDRTGTGNSYEPEKGRRFKMMKTEKTTCTRTTLVN
jgi:hypothetical protein